MYDSYDMFLFPTHHREPFGFAPLEAASRGCVALISEDCGIAEWLVDGVHLLKAPRVADDFAAVIRDVLDGKIKLAPVAWRGADVIWRDFHVDVVIAGVERTLADVAARKSRPTVSPPDAYKLAVLAERLQETAVMRNSL
jgi:glycosyltransferase involved in cell wall biosynthesis